MSIIGIDISKYQGKIDWKKVKNDQISFAMIRASTGIPTTDSKFIENMKAAHNINKGVYHYSYATSVSEAVAEAKYLLALIKSFDLTYPVAFDIEDKTQENLSNTVLTDICCAFCDEIENAGYYVIIYSMASWLNYKLNHKRLDKYDKWVAHVGVKQPSYNKPFGMWQYDWKGRVNGITTDVDMNIAYKDYPRIIKKLRKKQIIQL